MVEVVHGQRCRLTNCPAPLASVHVVALPRLQDFVHGTLLLQPSRGTNTISSMTRLPWLQGHVDQQHTNRQCSHPYFGSRSASRGVHCSDASQQSSSSPSEAAKPRVSLLASNFNSLAVSSSRCTCAIAETYDNMNQVQPLLKCDNQQPIAGRLRRSRPIGARESTGA